MPNTLIISGRGQITLPAAIRKRLGLRSGDAVLVERRGGEIVLKPGVVHEIQHYSDEQIAQWDADDKIEPHERTRLLNTASPSK